MKVGLSIETRRLPSGKLEVLLTRQTGGYKDSKEHRELLELPDNETTSLLERHIRRIANSG